MGVLSKKKVKPNTPSAVAFPAAPAASFAPSAKRNKKSASDDGMGALFAKVQQLHEANAEQAAELAALRLNCIWCAALLPAPVLFFGLCSAELD
eukprot:3256416-Pleurochrysis_carterae.AAC.1